MQLSESEMRVIARVRRNISWRFISLTVLGSSSTFMLAISIALGMMLVRHLDNHGVALAEVFSVLAEAQHPSQIQILHVFAISLCLAVSLYVAFLSALSTIGFCQKGREQRLLLKLVEDRNVPEASGNRGDEDRRH